MASAVVPRCEGLGWSSRAVKRAFNSGLRGLGQGFDETRGVLVGFCSSDDPHALLYIALFNSSRCAVMSVSREDSGYATSHF